MTGLVAISAETAITSTASWTVTREMANYVMLERLKYERRLKNLLSLQFLHSTPSAERGSGPKFYVSFLYETKDIAELTLLRTMARFLAVATSELIFTRNWAITNTMATISKLVCLETFQCKRTHTSLQLKH